MIRENILKIKKTIASACAASGRKADEVTLLCVTKNRSVEEIRQVLESGVRDIGENKVQEALLKYKQLSDAGRGPQGIRWHMIGHLQTNKARDAVRIFDLIHSVDSLRLAEEIDRQAAGINKVQEILIEVHTSEESSKSGVRPSQLAELIGQAVRLKNLRLLGLMTMAPAVDDPEKTRPYFKRLRELFAQVNSLPDLSDRLSVLSMGMSGDFRIAVEEGATIVRIGRAVFQAEEL